MSSVKSRLLKIKERLHLLIDKKSRLETDNNLVLKYTNRNRPGLQLCRQFNGTGIDIDILEARSNLDIEFFHDITELCTFTLEEIKTMVIEESEFIKSKEVGHKSSNLYQIFCDDETGIRILKQSGSVLFLTRFIIEDDIVYVFPEKENTVGNSLYLYMDINKLDTQ